MKTHKPFNPYKFTLIFLITLALGSSVYATLISDSTSTFTGDIQIPDNNVNASNFYFGSTYGSFNETCPNRPFTSNEARTITVDDSGGADYTTIQEAVCQVPFILRHEWRINVKNGTYDEDVYIPSTTTSGINSPATEGSVVILQIDGESMIDTKVKSFQATSIIGTWGLTISNFNVYGQEYSSDENASISIYGSNNVLLMGLNFTGTVNTAILAYSSGVYLHSSYFNTNQQYGMQVKRGGFGVFGDDYNNQSNHGNLSSYLVSVSDGIININSANDVTPGGSGVYAHCPENSEGFIFYKGGILCPGIPIISENAFNESFIYRTERPSMIYNLSGRDIFLGTTNDETFQDGIKIFGDNSNSLNRYIQLIVSNSEVINFTSTNINMKKNVNFNLKNLTQIERACFTSNCSTAYLRYNGSCIVSSNDAEASCI